MTNSEGDEMRLSIREVNSCMKTDVLEDGDLYIVTSLKIDEETEICMHNASNVVKVGRVILDVLRNER